MRRRSESCPRLTRKGSAAPVETAVMLQGPPTAPLPHLPVRTCTLQDLGPEDKQKVAKLLKQVVDLGQEVQQLRQQRDETGTSAQREQELQDVNKQLHKEHQALKKKLGQVLIVLRAAQTKINTLETAFQASRCDHCSVAVQTDATPAEERRDQVVTTPSATDTDSAVTGSAAEVPSERQRVSLAASSAVAVTDVSSSITSPTGMPPILHVAPGANINITIHHAPELSTNANKATGAAPAGPVAPSTFCKLAESSACEQAEAPGVTVTDNTVTSVHPVVVAIPTSTATAAVATPTSVSGVDVARPQMVNGIQSPTGVTRCGPIPVALGAAGCGGRVPSALMRASCSSAGSLAQVVCRSGGPRDILVDATSQHFEAVPVHEVSVDSHDANFASPMIIPPDDEVVAAASSLLGWQALNGFAAAGEAAAKFSAASVSAGAGLGLDSIHEARAGRKVLSFDPAIGKNGAFYFVDVADAEAFGTPNILSDAAAAKMEGVMWNHAGVKTAVASIIASGTVTAAASSTPLHRPTTELRPTPADELCHQQSHIRRDASMCSGSRTAGTNLHASFVSTKQLPPSRPGPLSPSGSITTESTALLTPGLQAGMMAAMQGSDDPPSASTASLSRMAHALDQMARRQRWDMQAPAGLQQGAWEQGATSPVVNPGSGWMPTHRGSQIYNCDTGPSRPPTGNSVVSLRRLTQHADGVRPGSASRRRLSAEPMGTFTRDTVAAFAGPLDSPTPSGHDYSGPWQGSYSVMDRYDDSLMDILSQADEDMECNHSQLPRNEQRQAQSYRQHGVASVRTAAAAVRDSRSAAKTMDKSAASVRTLLDANLYEENDVLSVILEQESDSL